MSARLVIDKVRDGSKGRRSDERGEEIGSVLVVSESDAT